MKGLAGAAALQREICPLNTTLEARGPREQKIINLAGFDQEP